jgi:hypothetical protein
VTAPGRVLAVLAAILWGAPAAAYRPFDSTDADVVDRGEIEIELGPVGWLYEDGTQQIVAPDLVVNLGLHRRLELVVEGRGVVALGRDPEHRYRIDDTALLAKWLARRGTLQEEAGPSLALELGMLLPTLHAESGVGAEGIAIGSYRFPHLTAHLNAAAAWTRAETAEIGVGLILEGPERWGVRPVAEATFSHEFDEGNQASGLLGLIWDARSDLAFDLAFRYARDDGSDTREVRAGLTFSFDLVRGDAP